MEYAKLGNQFYLRLDPGDEILACLKKFMEEEGLESASFQGIGACSYAEVGVYQAETHSYHPFAKEEKMEIVSLLGNVRHKEDGSLYPHVHAMFSYENRGGELAYFGGHLLKGVISFTGEIVISPVKGGALQSEPDPKLGISRWKFEQGK